MKILQIVPSYKPAYIYGGPIESVSKLCESLAEQGDEVNVFTTTANGKAELNVISGEFVNVDGVSVIYFKRITKDPLHISPALWKYLYKNVRHYDIVHIHSWWNMLVIVSAIICHNKGVKVVVSPRGMLSKYIFGSGRSVLKKLIHSVIGKRLLLKSWYHATSVAENKDCQDIMVGWKGLLLPNIVSLPEVVPFILEKNSAFTLIFMSRIHQKKGIELLFHAISKLKFNIILKIAGSGEPEYVLQLKELAKELNISDKIEWLGWVERPHKFAELRNADLFTLISFNENFANVVIEALHMGTPVLLSNGVALSEFVKNENLGWISNLEVEDIVSKISEAYKDKTKRQWVNENGKILIERNFSSERLINKYSEGYRQIIASAS